MTSTVKVSDSSAVCRASLMVKTSELYPEEKVGRCQQPGPLMGAASGIRIRGQRHFENFRSHPKVEGVVSEGETVGMFILIQEFHKATWNP